MSRETLEWLNQNTLIGFTDKRGHAWHYREGSDNHYAGAVPMEDVKRRLFNWTAEEHPLYVANKPQEVCVGRTVYGEVPGYKAIARSDNGEVLGIFGDGYVPHQYGEWLLKNVSGILDADLSIGSAGLLKGGRQAWVSVEVPDTITTPEGVQYRPNLLAVSSLDGTLATTYKRVVTNVVCDNTMNAGLREQGQEFKVKSTRHSMGRMADAREALGIVHTIADDFAAEVKELCEMDFTDQKFAKLVEDMTPYDPDAKSSRGETMAMRKRDKLHDLWASDERVVTWRGTAYGAWQAFNTYGHHEGPIKGGNRAERNMIRTVTGQTEKADEEIVTRIRKLARR
jgi:phage/plasmid-like protein (TIGR03299 family)